MKKIIFLMILVVSSMVTLADETLWAGQVWITNNTNYPVTMNHLHIGINYSTTGGEYGKSWSWDNDVVWQPGESKMYIYYPTEYDIDNGASSQAHKYSTLSSFVIQLGIGGDIYKDNCDMTGFPTLKGNDDSYAQVMINLDQKYQLGDDKLEATVTSTEGGKDNGHEIWLEK